MCLIKGRESHACTHEWCRLEKKNPKIYGLTNGKAISKRNDFIAFSKHKGHPADWVMAVNPYEKGSEERNNFESFRQGRTELEAVGFWPENKSFFLRQEVNVEFVECRSRHSVFNEATNEIEWIYTIDVNEVAVYCGDGCIPFDGVLPG